MFAATLLDAWLASNDCHCGASVVESQSIPSNGVLVPKH